MKCHLAEAQFSERHEGTLGPQDAEQLEAHLASCANCSAAWAAFERALERLHSLNLSATPKAYAAQVSAAVFAVNRPKAAAGAATPVVWIRRVLTHAAALLLGCGLVAVTGPAGGADGDARALAQLDPPPPTVIEVPVQVPVEHRVEVPVEVRVEVPVEVIREVPKEVIKEVTKEVIVERVQYVDRPVANPLQVDFDRQQALAVNLSGALHETFMMARLALEHAAQDRPAPQVLRGPRTGDHSLTEVLAVAPMVVLRDHDSLRIQTRGEVEDVVPALIATLDGPDRELAAAAELHLNSIRQRLAEQAGEPLPTPFLTRATAATSEGDRSENGGVGGWFRSLSSAGPEPQSPEVAPRERWQVWWNTRMATQVAVGTR